MKFKFQFIDRLIVETLAKRPLRLEELLEMTTIRNEALRLNIRRAGVSPSKSADTTVNERLQALRRNGSIAYDSATNRWDTL